MRLRHGLVLVAVGGLSCDDFIQHAGSSDDLGPFDAPSLVAELADASSVDDDPTLTGDELLLYFNSDRPGGTGGSDIWKSSRQSPGESWQAPEPDGDINTVEGETTPELSDDGLVLWWASDRAGGAEDLWRVQRSSLSASWGPAAAVVELNSSDNDFSPTFALEQRTIVFVSDRAGDRDLFISTRANASDPWATPIPLTELNTDAGETSPFLTRDGLCLYFNSDRSGGLGRMDLYRACRSSVGEAFAGVTSIDELNTEHQEEDVWLSRDGRHIYFASDRTGDNEIYEARR